MWFSLKISLGADCLRDEAPWQGLVSRRPILPLQKTISRVTLAIVAREDDHVQKIDDTIVIDVAIGCIPRVTFPGHVDTR